MSGSTIYSGWVTAFCFWNEDGHLLYNLASNRWTVEPHLYLDGAYYHEIDSTLVPPGWGKVPVRVDDNGNEFDALMVAGSIDVKCTNSGEELSEDVVGLDSMSPETGWWMMEKKQGGSE